MDFLGGLGNLFHSIGNIIGGGNNNAPQNQPTTVRPSVQPGFQPTPPQNTFQPTVQPNQNTLFQGQPKPASLLPAGAPSNQASNPLTQAMQLQRAQPAPAPAQPNNDPVGNFIGGVIHPFAQFGNALIHVPQAIGREIQNKPIDDIQRNVFGTNDQGQIAKDIIGDTANVGLTALAPGVDNLAEKGASALLPEAANVGERLVTNLVPKVASGTALGGAFGGVNAAENNQDIGQGVASGALLGGVGGGVLGSLPLLSRIGAEDTTAIDASGKLPNETVTGLHSVNPNKASDAQAAASAPEAAQLQPAGTAQPQPQAGTPPLEATPSQGAETPQVQPQASPATVQPQPANIENPSLADNVAQTTNEVKPNPSGTTAPNAPNIRDQLTKDLGDAAGKAGDPTEHDVFSNADLKQAADRAVQNTPPAELVSKYSGVPNLKDATDLAHAHSSLPVLADLSKSADPATAQAAKNAIDNIMEGAEKGVSGAGRTMNYAQGMYDSLPREAQVSLTIRTLDKARVAAGLPQIADNLPLRAEIETKLNNLLAQGEDLRGQQATIEGKIQAIQDSANSKGNLSNAETQAHAQELADLQKQQSALDIQSKTQNGETARYYNSLLPGKAGLQKAADFARTSMLTAPSGRINNFFNVGGNSMYEVARSIPQSWLNSAINALKGNAEGETTSLANRGLLTGFKEGLQKTGAELKGSQLVGDVKSASGRNPDTGAYEFVNTTDNRGFNKVANITRALVKAPSNIVGGAIKNAQLVRSAAQEAAENGLTGNDAKIYTQARAMLPSKQMSDRAQILQDTVSHMNKNPLADMFGGIFGKANVGSQFSPNAKGAIGLIKNTFLPFPKYAATFAWNTLTDRNVVADAVRVGAALRSGDTNALTRAISGGALDAGGMYVGYHLAQQGLITNKDANGYSDSGAYLHFGNRYIPLGFLGVNGEALLAGTAMFNSVNGKGNPAQVFGSTVGNTLLNTVKMAGAQNLVGADNTALTALQNAFTGKNNVSPIDAAAQVGGTGVGQFIPGAFSDINAVLNKTGLDPTGEAAQTKVEKGASGALTATGKPSTAKDIAASEVNVLKNRIPFVSQTLPRNAAVNAPDLIDRVTRGSSTGPVQQAAAQVKLDAAAQVADDVKNGVPVMNAPAGTYPKGVSPADVLESTIEKGNFDQAIKGLQNELKDYQGKGLPTTKTEPVQNQIKQLGVLKSQGLPPAIRDTYANTSVAAWRKMGDPTSDSYNPTLYQTLAKYDAALADQGIAGGSAGAAGKSSSPKFYASASGSGGSSAASKLVRSNTIGSLPTLARESFINNLAMPAQTLNLPEAKLTAPGSLIPAHKISVGMPKA